MHQYSKSTNLQALSLYNQRYKRGKKSGSPSENSSRKHLLGLMSSFAREEQEVRMEEIEELCCYDRMKKLLMRNEDKFNQDKESNEKDLMKAVHIQAKITKLQRQMAEKQTRKMQSNQNVVKTASQHFIRKTNIIKQVKQKCVEKFLQHKVQNKERALAQIRLAIEKEVDSKINFLFQQKNANYDRLKEQCQNLERQIRVKTLEIQALKLKQANMQQYIKELEQKTSGMRPQPKKNISALTKNQCEAFVDKFNQLFGGMSMQEVKNRLEFSINKCLEGFDRVSNKNDEKLREQSKIYEQKFQLMRKQIQKLEIRQNQLMFNLRNIKINKQISQIEINELLKAKTKLNEMQKLILSLYNEWYAERTENQKQEMRSLGNLKENYSYKEMLRYIVDYDKKLSTNSKLNDFILKILRGVQKLRRTIFPEECNQKLDPLVAMEKIQKWIKLKLGRLIRQSKGKKVENDESQKKYFEQTMQVA